MLRVEAYLARPIVRADGRSHGEHRHRHARELIPALGVDADARAWLVGAQEPLAHELVVMRSGADHSAKEHAGVVAFILIGSRKRGELRATERQLAHAMLRFVTFGRAQARLILVQYFPL